MGTQSKSKFLTAFDAALPDGVANFASTTLNFSGAAAVTTEEEAIIEMGKLAAKWNAILDNFAGYTPVNTLLHIGQRNRVNRVAMLSGLEAADVTGDFRVLTPQDGGAYVGHFGIREGEWYAAQIVRGAADSVAVTLGEESFDLEETDGVWQAEWPTPLGDYAATLTATFAGGKTAQKTVNFSVLSYAVYPPDGATIPIGEDFEISIDTRGDDVTSASVEIKTEDGEVIYSKAMSRMDEEIMACVAYILPDMVEDLAVNFITVISLQLASMTGQLNQIVNYTSPGTMA